MTKFIFTLAAAALVGCTATTDKDTGDTAVDTAVDTDTDTDTDTAVEDVVTSCDWPEFGICFEFVNYADSQAWCDDKGVKYETTAVHADAGCAAGAVATCDIPTGGEDFPAPATAYYYDPDYTVETANAACDSAGGTAG
jgi:hypothetical protein